jgi:hypothetical protein
MRLISWTLRSGSEHWARATGTPKEGNKAGHCWARALFPAKPYQASQLAACTVGSKAGHCWACLLPSQTIPGITAGCGYCGQ